MDTEKVTEGQADGNAGGQTGSADSSDSPREDTKPSVVENLQQVQEARCEPILPNWDDQMYEAEYSEVLLSDGDSKPGRPKVTTILIRDEI